MYARQQQVAFIKLFAAKGNSAVVAVLFAAWLCILILII